jgi:hypothetical protein
MRLLVALVVWAAALVGAFALSSAVANGIHSTGLAGSGGSFDASSVASTDPQSLFRTANLARALAIVRAHLGPDAQLDNVALYPGYLDVTAVPAGSEVEFYVDAQGGYQITDTGGNPGGDTLFPLARVTANVPAALARRIATAGHVPESQLNYMVVDVNPATNQLEWLVYPHQGNQVEYFQASGATGRLFELPANSSTGPQPVAG